MAARTEYDTRWDDVLRLYAAAGHENGSAIASLILGITSVVVPILGILAAPFAPRRQQYVDGEEEQVPVEPVPTGQVGD